MDLDHDDEWFLISEKRSNVDRKCLHKTTKGKIIPNHGGKEGGKEEKKKKDNLYTAK